MARQSDQKLIRSAFVRMMVVNMFVLVSSSICGFMDNIIIGRLMGTDALAAVGYFSPALTAISLFNTIVLGVQILCGNYIGSGKKDQINFLFFSAFAVLGGVFAALGTAGVIFRDSIASLLGAEGSVHELLSGYMAGYMPGVPVMALSALLMGLVSYNNDLRRSYIAAGALAVANAAGDLLLADMGTFGIGLASTLSSLISFLILLPGYVRKDRVLHLVPGRLAMNEVGKALVRGLPSLMFTAGLIVKNALMNYTLSTWGGSSGVAVVNVLGSVCGIVGIVSGGFGIACSTLASLYYGEEDKTSFTGLFRIAMWIGETIFVFIVVVIMAGSGLLASVFFPAGTGEWEIGKQMFLLGFLFYPVNILLSCLKNFLHAQGQMTIVNIFAVVETAMVGVMVLLTVPSFGLDAAWLANLWVDILCVLAMFACAWIRKKKVDFRADTLLMLPDNFGASEDEYREYYVKDIHEVPAVSEAIETFCKERSISDRYAFFAGLCVEEMAGNVFRHGSLPGKKPFVNIRVVAQKDLTIRIRDNCREFDPLKRVEVFSSQSAEQYIGIRLTVGLAHQVDYYNNAGINTLLIKI